MKTNLFSDGDKVFGTGGRRYFGSCNSFVSRKDLLDDIGIDPTAFLQFRTGAFWLESQGTNVPITDSEIYIQQWQNCSVVTTRKRTIVWSSSCGLRISRNISSFYDRSLRCRLIRSQNPQWCNLLEPKGFRLSFPGLGWRCAVATFLPCQTQKGETSVS
jgi:hypothetical protein